MEDHLRNKYRLDQEWQALCSYEAEPSTSVFVASKVSGSKLAYFLRWLEAVCLLNLLATSKKYLYYSWKIMAKTAMEIYYHTTTLA